MTRALASDLQTTVEVLCDASLDHVVDLVCWPDPEPADDLPAVLVANSRGRVRLTPAGHEVLDGADPIGDEDPLAATPLEVELADRSPANDSNSYPLAYERLAGLFAAPDAPDLSVVHTGKHHWPERGGHLGEHGSLDVVQSRAPLLLSGPAVRASGLIADSARVIDVAPTLAWLVAGEEARLSSYDGKPLRTLVDPAPGPVIGLLWDGCNSNSLYARAMSGELPNVARLLARGCALQGGAIAEFPSVTLVNHTSALTGVGPGSHGIVNNAYYSRTAGEQRLTNDARTWHRWAEWLAPGVRTVFEQVPCRTACVNEPADAGADYSTFSLVRDSGSSDGASGMDSALPDPKLDPLASQQWVQSRRDYAWSSSVDAIGLTQMLELFEEASDVPRLTWWNTLLTDTGHHAGGPHSDVAHDSMADADRRLGMFLNHLESLRLLESTTFLLTSDHGSEGAEVECTGDWDEPLREAGLEFRDEAYGFIYLGVS